eukprot:jgi/Chlat1/5035/Chrsp329S00828
MDEGDVASEAAPLSKLQQWRLAREEAMRAQVEKERARKAGLAEAACADLNRTYESRTKQVQGRHELNVELEERFISERDKPIKKVWPKVVKIALGDDQRKSARKKKSMLQPDDVLRSNDKARFREVLHQLAARDGQQYSSAEASTQSANASIKAVPAVKVNGNVGPIQHASAELTKANAAELTSTSPPPAVTMPLKGQLPTPAHELVMDNSPTPIAPIPPLTSTAQHEVESLYHAPSPLQEQLGTWPEDESTLPLDDAYRETVTAQNGFFTPSRDEQDNAFMHESTPTNEQVPSPFQADVGEAIPALPVSPKPTQAGIAAQLEEKRAELERLKKQSGCSRDKLAPGSNISPGWSGHLLPEETDSPKHQVLKPRHVKAAGGQLFTAKTPQQLDAEINSLQQQVRELERQHAETEQ